MKIQNIYHLLQAALLLLLVSCTQEEFPAVQDKAQQLTISVTDGGYTSAVENMKTRVETRAVENGYTTEFTEGDACGFYMVRGGKPVYSNVKLTAEKDAATGGIMWKTDGTTLAAGMDGESYYLYYPYQADMAGKTATPAEGAVMTDAEFFKPLIDGWQPGDDQSTHAAYTASDLMTAGGSTTGTGNTIHLSFAMKHRMALAVIEMPKTVYKFIDANVPDYTVGAEATFGTAKPLRMADGTYRYLVHSSMPTIEGCYDGGNREFTITTSASHPVVGEYKRYKVDGAAETIKNVTYAESGIARIGDFYCTKDNGTTGYLIPKEADETTVQAATVVGIVFQTDKSRIGQAEKNALGGKDKVHGLVMSVKNIATRQAWSLFHKDEGLTTCKTKADNYNDISGYGNCEHIRTNRGNFDSYPAFKAAYDYNTTCPVPATTTGWYLPASGQWWDILQNLGGCPALADVTQQTSPDIAGEFLWKSQGDVPAALNKWMENIAVGDKDTFNNLVSFCSSSEHSTYHTWYWILNNFQGMVRCIWESKFDGSDNVRPVLAF